LKIKALGSFETPETARPATQCHIPDFTEHFIFKTKLQYVNFKHSVAYDNITYQLHTAIINTITTTRVYIDEYKRLKAVNF